MYNIVVRQLWVHRYNIIGIRFLLNNSKKYGLMREVVEGTYYNCYMSFKAMQS